jgi:hypothetical protein
MFGEQRELSKEENQDRLIFSTPCVVHNKPPQSEQRKSLLVPTTFIRPAVKHTIAKGKMNFAIFLDIAPCSPYVNLRFGGIHHLLPQGKQNSV